MLKRRRAASTVLSVSILSELCRAMASLDEKVKLRFLRWQDLYNKEKPFEIVTESIHGSENRRTNLIFSTHGEQIIEDIRGRENTRFELDSHGFAYRSIPCSFDGYGNKQRILEEYLPWAESIIKQEVGDMSRVFVFDWRVSQERQEIISGSIFGLGDFAHVDQSCGDLILHPIELI